jgi:hypothetical protein
MCVGVVLVIDVDLEEEGQVSTWPTRLAAKGAIWLTM